MNNINLDKKIIVLTGGSGKLGTYFSDELIKYGARIANLDLVADPKKNTSDILNIKTNLLNKDEIKAALKIIKEQWGEPDGLINNAAIDSPPDAPVTENGPFEEYTDASWDKVMSSNVKSVFNVCQVIGSSMAKNMQGSIVNISSIYGLVSPDQSLYEYRRKRGEVFFKPIAYSASKSAILNMTRYLAVYWAKKSVRVNTLTFAGVENNQEAAFLEGYNQRIPIGRMAKPEDYVGALVFLLSNSSKYMTGSNLIIDGGWTAI